MALAALALVVFGAYDSYPNKKVSIFKFELPSKISGIFGELRYGKTGDKHENLKMGNSWTPRVRALCKLLSGNWLETRKKGRE